MWDFRPEHICGTLSLTMSWSPLSRSKTVSLSMYLSRAFILGVLSFHSPVLWNVKWKFCFSVYYPIDGGNIRITWYIKSLLHRERFCVCVCLFVYMWMFTCIYIWREMRVNGRWFTVNRGLKMKETDTRTCRPPSQRFAVAFVTETQLPSHKYKYKAQNACFEWLTEGPSCDVISCHLYWIKTYKWHKFTFFKTLPSNFMFLTNIADFLLWNTKV